MKKIYKSLIDRIAGNPITSIFGSILISIGIAVYLNGMHDAGMLAVGAGSTLILSTDQSNMNNEK